MSHASESVESRAETSTENGNQSYRFLRIWPAVILVVAILVAIFMRGSIQDSSFTVIMLVVMGPALAAILIFLWWGMFSRAYWQEKLIGMAAIVLAGFAATQLVDKSLLGFPIFTDLIPTVLAAFAGALILTGRMAPKTRTTLALLAILIGFGYWTLIRTDGMWGDFHSERSWRWEPTQEELFLKQIATRNSGSTNGIARQLLAVPEWPGFRGAERNAVVNGVTLQSDWNTNPPKELWRTKVGPGWSSFAIAGRRLFTMEQRGEKEAVVCFDTDTGDEFWAYEYTSRFWEAMGGAGPRATPTIANGGLFTLGGDGILLRLNAVNGDMIWQRDLKTDADREPPTWGFSASPLVVGDLVIVHAGGEDDKGIFAYHIDSGEPVWSAPSGDHSYSSPQTLSVADQEYVVMVSNSGVALMDASDGRVAFDHAWPSMGYRTLQPLLINSLSLVIGSGMGEGARRIDFNGSGEALSAAETWTTVDMESDFNDFVAYDGNLFGFDRNIFSCIDLETGERRWKKGRYGNGQVLLLADAGQLLVTSEKGELVLLNATGDKLDELARIKIFDGKTWNHAALVGDRLYMRNAEEAACYVLPIVKTVDNVKEPPIN